MYFSNFIKSLNQFFSSNNEKVEINGISHSQWCFFLYILHKNKSEIVEKHNHLMVIPSLEEAESLYTLLESLVKSTNLKQKVLLFPGLEYSPYSNFIPSEESLNRRNSSLTHITKSNPFIIVCTIESLFLKLPPKKFFKNYLSIHIGQNLSPKNFIKKLVKLGYKSESYQKDVGCFIQKGEIIDIFLADKSAVRINYFGDTIEKIFYIDKQTGKNLKDKNINTFDFYPTNNIFSNKEYSYNLRINIPQFLVKEKEKCLKRQYIFKQISNGELFDGFPNFVPLFFNENNTIKDFINNDTIITIFNNNDCELTFKSYLETLKEDYNKNNSSNVLPSHDKIYCDYNLDFNTKKNFFINNININTNIKNKLNINLEPFSSFVLRNALDKKYSSKLENIITFIKNNFSKKSLLLICYTEELAKEEIEKSLLKNIKNKIKYIKLRLNNGFFYSNENILVMSEIEIFTKRHMIKKNTNYDLSEEKIISLKEGDYIIHSEHGVGKYLGLKVMNINNQKNDYFIILYKNNDKIYLPIYKINEIQKYSDSNVNIKIDSLRSERFSNIKKSAQKSIKKAAFDLIKLQAERNASQGFSFSSTDHLYNEFELNFPFEETVDQKKAISCVIEDMQNIKPMDRLICGDVGFGKTEIAMRAAFKAVQDHKQVIVLTPTTILALQHYKTFKNRFENFPVNIDFLCRLRTTKESKIIREKIKNHSIDIIIGTHILLSNKITFSDLGLVIVDEEQSFGVNQKEIIKTIKKNIDFLTLTATPIPRTLQLAFMGIKDFSIIKTPPLKRLSIKTYILKEDDNIIRNIIKYELKRNGQVFIVHNRVHNIEQVREKVQFLLPKSKITTAHGKMDEKILEKRISDFYNHKYQILIATTIIQCGLDIPNVNTLIVNHADKYGLAQLHQLRGRIGRSERKAYAYFIIQKNSLLSNEARKRLQSLQLYSKIGSGLSIASSDLDIRGSGDILGAEQSGHIKNIGIELYIELLKNTILEMQNKEVIKNNLEISTYFDSYIPKNYIKSSQHRILYYKKLSNCSNTEMLNEIKEIITDNFGNIPEELKNLIIVIQSKILIQNIAIKFIKVMKKNILIEFDPQILNKNINLRDKIYDYFSRDLKRYSFTTNFSIVFKSKEIIYPTNFLSFSQKIAEHINI